MLKTKTLSVNGERDEFFILQTYHCAGRCREKKSNRYHNTYFSPEETNRRQTPSIWWIWPYSISISWFRYLATGKMSRGSYSWKNTQQDLQDPICMHNSSFTHQQTLNAKDITCISLEDRKVKIRHEINKEVAYYTPWSMEVFLPQIKPKTPADLLKQCWFSTLCGATYSGNYHHMGFP